MKEGDILEWRTINGISRGRVTKSENGQLVCKVDDRTSFRLQDVSHSKSLRIISAQSL